ncbi:MAG: radical SAM protein [Thermoanaerobaculia bacterium]
MSLGLNEKFSILQQSPHDSLPPEHPEPKEGGATTWVPSRYNIRATTEDGRLVLWNTFRGSMSVFQPDQVPQVLPLLSRKGIAAEAEGIVGYLVERGYLIKQGANEYRQVQVAIDQQQFRTDRLELILLASEDCNFRCKYCYEQFARGTMQPEVRTGIKNLVLRRLKRLASLQVSWFGGEPLYGFQAIEDLAPFFLQTAEENDLAYSGGMTTNAYLLTPEVADKLLAWKIRHYQITIDGLPADHDRNRPTRDGQGTFARIFDNLVALGRRDDDFGVTIRINFDQENHPGLPELLERLEKHFSGDTRFGLNFFPIGRWGGPQDADLKVCGKDEVNRVRQELRAEADRRGLKIGTIKGINRIGGEVCYAARPYNLIIGATGKIMKCTIALDTEDYNVVGTLNEDGDLHLGRDKMALWTEPAFEGDTRCQKCVVLPICQGTHCPLIRIVDHKSPCCSVRSSPKRQLLDVVKYDGARARRAIVGVPADPVMGG